MKKLRMEMDALAVESFAAEAPYAPGVAAAGPVTPYPCSEIDACPSALTCTVDTGA